MTQLLAEIRQRHADLAGRVVGSIVVDEHHLTDGQLLAKAREFYAARYPFTATLPSTGVSSRGAAAGEAVS